MNKICVLLAAFNGIRWLPEQINSIFGQKGEEVTIYVSVDTSSDGTELFCSHLAQNNNIILLPFEKFGSAVKNFFRLLRDVNFLNFDYIALSDQDDIWHSDKLSNAIKIVKENRCDGYSSNVTAFWPDGRQNLINKAQPQVEWDYLFESAGPGCTFVLTKRLAIELQAFVRSNQEAMLPVWMHDWFIYAFARSHGYKWYIDKYPSMLYRQHENNLVGVNIGYKSFLYRMRFVLSGKALQQSSLIASLCGLKFNPFVKRWHGNSRLDMLYLAVNAKKCRRKYSEKLLFALACLILFFVKRNASCANGDETLS